MAATVTRARTFLGTVVDEVQENNVPFMAASIAYHAFVSLLPLLLLLIFVASLADQEGIARQVVDSITSFAPAAGGLLENAIEGAEQGTSVGIIGAVILLWGALKIFRGIDTAFSEIYGTEEETSLPTQIRDGLIVLVSLGVALIVTIIAGVVVALFPLGPLAQYASTGILILGLGLAFFPMFYVFPNVDVTPRGVLPGVALAAIGWAVLQRLFQVYVGFAGQAESYGILGGVLLLVTWLYFGGLLLLVAAVVNAVFEGYAGEEEEEMRALSTAETAQFLTSLREGLTGRYEGMRETETGDLELPESVERVDVVEVAETDVQTDDGKLHEVRLRWHL